MVGVAVKSLTGSRKVIEMLNKLGHCASYHTVEEIETELTFEATKDKKFTPNGTTLSPNLGTGLAWDNYDRFVETGSGEDTLHDTVGIAYQVFLEDELQNINDNHIEENCSVANISKKSKRRRTYEPRGLNIEPYRKKPKLRAPKFLPNNDVRRISNEREETSPNPNWKMDILWMKNLAVQTEIPTPMWAGWNSLHCQNRNYTQKYGTCRKSTSLQRIIQLWQRL